MNKNLLIRHFEGLATKQEEASILSWVEKKPENREYYCRLRDSYIALNMPQGKCSDSEMETADKIVRDSSIRSRRSRRTRLVLKATAYAAAACLIAVVAFKAGSSSRSASNEGQRITLSYIPGTYKHTLYTEKGVKSTVTLPDGSQVWMNSDTRLEFPDKFIGDTREVFLSGEAFFKVVHNPQKPMIVTTNRNFIIKVLGTEFNVRTYSDDATAKTTLYKGSIEMYSKDSRNQYKLMARLSPCQSYIYNDKSTPSVKAGADTLVNNAWRRGCLIFENAPMEDVFKELERWHGVDIEVRDQRAYHYQFNANFENESLVQILESLKFCTDITYAIKDKKVEIYVKDKTKR